MTMVAATPEVTTAPAAAATQSRHALESLA